VKASRQTTTKCAVHCKQRWGRPDSYLGVQAQQLVQEGGARSRKSNHENGVLDGDLADLRVPLDVLQHLQLRQHALGERLLSDDVAEGRVLGLGALQTEAAGCLVALKERDFVGVSASCKTIQSCITSKVIT
jgi:hypothetical protein